MADEQHLSNAERLAIREHVDRVVFYSRLRDLVVQWRADLEQQKRADYIAKRVLGGLGALASAAVAAYFAHSLFALLWPIPASPIYISRVGSLYGAGILVAFSCFCFGIFFAAWGIPHRLYVTAVYSLPAAMVLVLLGFLVAPAIIWSIAF